MPFTHSVEFEKASVLKVATAYDDKAKYIQATVSFHVRVTPEQIAEIVNLQRLSNLKVIVGTEQLDLEERKDPKQE